MMARLIEKSFKVNIFDIGESHVKKIGEIEVNLSSTDSEQTSQALVLHAIRKHFYAITQFEWNTKELTHYKYNNMTVLYFKGSPDDTVQQLEYKNIFDRTSAQIYIDASIRLIEKIDITTRFPYDNTPATPQPIDQPLASSAAAACATLRAVERLLGAL